ncbi:hypothetical protein ABZ070_16705 [Streptomyces sp. NPDC006283]|uniref:hypothetical protein n=1 Tax=Streptomyces sp. NPDC006283 TaxID=3156741 RepID=UPI0033ACD460
MRGRAEDMSAGHFIGGATAAATMATDDRVRAGADLGGDFYLHPAGTGLGRRYSCCSVPCPRTVPTAFGTVEYAGAITEGLKNGETVTVIGFGEGRRLLGGVSTVTRTDQLGPAGDPAPLSG